MGMDVLYTANDKYIDIMLTSMVSLIHNGGFDNITFHIIAENYSYEDYKRVYDVLTRYDNVDLFFYNLEDYNIEEFNIPKWKNTQIANARVFYNRILDKNPKGEQILYLDSDTLVVDKIDVIRGNEGNPIYAVQDSTRKE
jgi:lipopolysaccharide biosynthesis glycosyltransferase